MDCGMRGTGRKDGLKRRSRRGKRGGCGEDGADRRCGFHRRRRRMLYISILAGMISLHITAWSSSEFCDWYQRHVFGIWVDTYGRLVGLVPFSVGEVLIGFGAGFGAVGAVLGAIWLIDRAAVAWGKRRRKRCGGPGEIRGSGLKRDRALGEARGNGQRRARALGEVQGSGLKRARALGEVRGNGQIRTRVFGEVQERRQEDKGSGEVQGNEQI